MEIDEKSALRRAAPIESSRALGKHAHLRMHFHRLSEAQWNLDGIFMKIWMCMMDCEECSTNVQLRDFTFAETYPNFDDEI